MKHNINGLAVETSGDSNKQTIIFVHGFPYNLHMWDNQFAELSKDFHCVRYDIRGLGESYVGDGQYTMEAYVNDLFMIMNELNLTEPVVCGLSMGGYLTFRALEREQHKFRAAILLDTKPNADDNANKLRRAAGIDQINTAGLEAFVDAFVPNTFSDNFKKEEEEIYNNTLKQCKANNPTGVKGAIIAMLSRTDTSDFLPELKIPVLVIAGNLDKLTPPQIMREFANRIPNAEFAIAPRSGHMSPIENPSFVNDMIRGFVKRVAT